MFVGNLGRERSILFMPRNQVDFHLSTDLIGMTPVTYGPDREDNNMRAATGPACNQVRKVLNKFGSKSMGYTSVSDQPIKTEHSAEVAVEERREPTVSDEAQEQETNSDASSTDTEASASPLEAMIREMLSNGHTERAEDLYQSALQTEDVDEQYRIQAIQLHLRVQRGDVDALTSLRNLAEELRETSSQTAPMAYNLLGLGLKDGSSHQQAIRAFETAAELASTDEERAQYLTSAAETLFSSDYRDRAFSTIVNELNKASDVSAQATLYTALADLHGKAKNELLRAAALQKATEYSPNDTQLRFNAAYSSSEVNLNDLTVMHYQTLLRFQSHHPMTYNNLGVTFGELGMPTKEVDAYKRAVNDGETLAAANLANLYTKAGFSEEARAVLDEAQARDSIHPNVGSAIAALGQKEETESNTLDQVLSKAHKQQEFIRLFAEGYWCTPASDPHFVGTWELSTGAEATVHCHNNGLQIQWEVNIYTYEVKANAQNRGALVSSYERKDEALQISLGDQGYVLLSEDNNQLDVMTSKNGSHTFLQLTRKYTHEP